MTSEMLLAATETSVSVPTWVLIFLLAGGVWGISAGLLFRAGRLRRLSRWSFDPSLPAYIRNLPFETLPAGLMFFSGAAIILLYLQHTTWGDLFGVLALFAFLATVFALARAALRPPNWMKPDWLREEERRRVAQARFGATND
jgi:hypothetical protein